MGRNRESYYFSKLGEHFPELTNGEVIHLSNPDDPPDFLVKQKDIVLGIEITELMNILPGEYDLQQQLKFLQEIVDSTKDKFEKGNDRLLMVEFLFHDHIKLRRSEIDNYSNTLSEYIVKKIEGKKLKKDEVTQLGSDYPYYVRKILVREINPPENPEIWSKDGWSIQKTIRQV